MPDAEIVATRADERIGPPAFCGEARFGLADETAGDEGLGRLLDGQPDVVLVEVGRHLADVDTVPQDLERSRRRAGCDDRYLPVEGPTRGYLYRRVSACWQAFNEVIAREFGDAAYGVVHRHTVDTYAVQHPGTDDRRERQSVAVHLIGLCHWLEHGHLGEPSCTRITQALATANADWPWLDSAGPLRDDRG